MCSRWLQQDLRSSPTLGHALPAREGCQVSDVQCESRLFKAGPYSALMYVALTHSAPPCHSHNLPGATGCAVAGDWVGAHR